MSPPTRSALPTSRYRHVDPSNCRDAIQDRPRPHCGLRTADCRLRAVQGSLLPDASHSGCLHPSQKKLSQCGSMVAWQHGCFVACTACLPVPYIFFISPVNAYVVAVALFDGALVCSVARSYDASIAKAISSKTHELAIGARPLIFFTYRFDSIFPTYPPRPYGATPIYHSCQAALNKYLHKYKGVDLPRVVWVRESRSTIGGGARPARLRIWVAGRMLRVPGPHSKHPSRRPGSIAAGPLIVGAQT